MAEIRQPNQAPESLSELFSSRVRAAVLALMLPRPHLAFSLTDLSRRLDIPISSAQHECYKLARLGLLRDERVGSARRYQPDPAWPLFVPLTDLTVRALETGTALAGAVEGVAGISGCWISGPLDQCQEPLYLVVTGELALEALDGVFARARIVMEPHGAGRLELAYFREGDWAARLAGDNPFALSLLDQPRLAIIDPANGPADTS
ncbi:MAG: winged helix-turn-helix domain-containing protein [Thermomicrobiales bacterium]